MQNQTQKFNESNVVYQAEVQKAIQDAQLDSGKDSREYESKLRKLFAPLPLNTLPSNLRV